MKKIYIYLGIGGWLLLLSFILIGITTFDSTDEETIEEAKHYQMHEVVTHNISTQQSIAVRVTNATIVLDSKTPQSCILGVCTDDRKPGKYVLTVTIDITNLGKDEYFGSPYLFEIEDAEGQRYTVAPRDLDFISDVRKGETYVANLVYDVDPPISQYKLVLQDGNSPDTIIDLNDLQKHNPRLCEGTGRCLAGFVEKIIDGDTLDILDIESGETKRIRLSLVDTPERGEENFENAKDFTAGFCPVDSYVVFDEDDGQTNGSGGRLVGKLFCEGHQINKKLLEHNLAEIDTRFCAKSEYGNESWAKNYGC